VFKSEILSELLLLREDLKGAEQFGGSEDDEDSSTTDDEEAHWTDQQWRRLLPFHLYGTQVRVHHELWCEVECEVGCEVGCELQCELAAVTGPRLMFS
jgi:hypothetical protein